MSPKSVGQRLFLDKKVMESTQFKSQCLDNFWEDNHYGNLFFLIIFKFSDNIDVSRFIALKSGNGEKNEQWAEWIAMMLDNSALHTKDKISKSARNQIKCLQVLMNYF